MLFAQPLHGIRSLRNRSLGTALLGAERVGKPHIGKREGILIGSGKEDARAQGTSKPAVQQCVLRNLRWSAVLVNESPLGERWYVFATEWMTLRQVD